MTHRLPLVLVLLATALALAPADAAAQRRDRAAYRSWVDTTIALAPGGTVDVGALSVDVVVEAWGRREVHVRAYAERGRIETTVSGGGVSLRVEPDGDRRTGRIGESHIRLTVPVGTRVRATTTTGDVTISDTRGEVEASANSGDVAVRGARGLTTLRSLSGDVTASDLDGDVVAGTSSGDVVLRGVRGDVRAAAVSGDLHLTGVAGRAVTARSTSGDVVFGGVLAPDGRYTLTTHSGDVLLALPTDARADVTVQTYSGALETAFPVVLGGGVGATRPRTFEFAVGGGGARLRVETFSGDVVLRREPVTGEAR